VALYGQSPLYKCLLQRCRDVGDHVEYCINVQHRSGLCWQAWRRFSDFVALHEELANELDPEDLEVLPAPPKKSWLPTFAQTDGFLEQRQRELQAYVSAVLNRPMLARHSAVQILLGVRTPDQPTGVRVVPRGEEHELEVRPSAETADCAPIDEYRIEIVHLETGTVNRFSRDVGATGRQAQRARIGRLMPGTHQFTVSAANSLGASPPISVAVDTAWLRAVSAGAPGAAAGQNDTGGHRPPASDAMSIITSRAGGLPIAQDPSQQPVPQSARDPRQQQHYASVPPAVRPAVSPDIRGGPDPQQALGGYWAASQMPPGSSFSLHSNGTTSSRPTPGAIRTASPPRPGRPVAGETSRRLQSEGSPMTSPFPIPARHDVGLAYPRADAFAPHAQHDAGHASRHTARSAPPLADDQRQVRMDRRSGAREGQAAIPPPFATAAIPSADGRPRPSPAALPSTRPTGRRGAMLCGVPRQPEEPCLRSLRPPMRLRGV